MRKNVSQEPSPLPCFGRGVCPEREALRFHVDVETLLLEDVIARDQLPSGAVVQMIAAFGVSVLIESYLVAEFLLELADELDEGVLEHRPVHEQDSVGIIVQFKSVT